MTKKKSRIIIIAIFCILCLALVGIFLLPKLKPNKVQNELKEDYEWDISWYDAGKDKYEITTKEQLFGLAELSETVTFEGKTITLGSDIVVNEGNATDWKETPPELEWIPIGGFAGTFDGQGHTISGLYSAASDEKAGLFQDTEPTCKIQNFKLVNTYFNVVTSEGVGAISAGGGGSFSRIYTDAVIECDGWYVGGIIGAIRTGASISECWFDGSISMTGRFGGGIAGLVSIGNGTIAHCLNTGDITSTFDGEQAATIGGLCGASLKRLVLSDSLNVGNVVSTNKRPEVGGAIGCVGSGGDATLSKVWTTEESASLGIGSVVTDKGSKADGICRQLPKMALYGVGAYQRTDLDFDKYWAAIDETTPVLTCFAETQLSVEGLTKGLEIDTSWYDVSKMEYILNTPEELYGFAYLAAGGEAFYGKIIKLGKDIVYNEGQAVDFEKQLPLNIWIPISGFSGTFDGQGHTISGLYANKNKDAGFFASTQSRATVKNLRIENSYFKSTDVSGSYAVGSISGQGGGTFEKIYSDAIVKSDGFFAGGLFGAFNQNASVSECWFAGSVDITERFGGGIVGTTLHYKGGQMKTKVSISHCLNTGTIYRSKNATDSATLGGICGVVFNTATIEDCFNTGKLASVKTESGKYDEIGSILGCIASKANCTVKDSWGTKESYPQTILTIKDDAISNIGICQSIEKANLLGYSAAQMTNLDFDSYWTVVTKDTPILKCFAKSIPSLKGIVRPDFSWYQESAKEYTLKTVAQLYGFAVLSSGNTFAGKTVKLGGNITVNTGDAKTWSTNAPSMKWNPIKNFLGTFDGQGYTISGLYGYCDTGNMGFFDETKPETVVKNLRIKNSFFKSKDISGNCGVGSIAGAGGGTYSNIYSNAIIDMDGYFAGGIVGALNQDGKITNCWFDGSVVLDLRYGGGITGAVINYKGGKVKTEGTIMHCLNTGTVYRRTLATNSATIGGIVGLVNNKAVIKDCLNIGKINSAKAESGKYEEYGSIIGCIASGANCTVDDVWASSESCPRTITTIKEDNKTTAKIGVCSSVNETNLQGYASYQLTSLDFEKNWAVVLNGTPMLQKFATTIPSVAGIVKPDTKWYQEQDGDYKIGTVEELYGLAMLSGNENFEGEKITLTANIDVNEGNAADWKAAPPLTKWSPILNFAGEFDGNGFTISGLYGEASEVDTVGMGLFAKTAESAKIHDFSLTNSYFTTKSLYALGAIASRGNGEFKNIYTNAILNNQGGGNTGGILGLALIGKVTIENCWSECNITDVGQRTGGILGNSNGQTVTIKHCMNSGEIQRVGNKVNSSMGFFGGIIGTASGSVVIDDCLNVGNVTSKRTVNGDMIGALVGEFAGNTKATISNLFTNETAVSKAGKMIGNNGNGTDVSECSSIKDNKLEGIEGYKWTSLDFDDYWAARDKTYPALKTFVPDDKELDVSNVVKPTIIPNLDWFDTTTNTGTIMTKEDLYGFVELSKTAGIFNKDTVIELGATIEVNSGKSTDWVALTPANQWSPIMNFAGTFNGKGFTIRGLYGKLTEDTTKQGMGLFAKTTADACIYNLRIENSYFANTCSEGLSALVSRGAGTFKWIYIHTDVILKNDIAGGNTNGSTGGIVGLAEGKAIIEECWFAGMLTANSKYNGGIIGNCNNQEVEIRHCLNSGMITRSGGRWDNSGTAGICGFTGGKLTIDDCLNIGRVSDADGHNNEVGAILGAANAAANGSITNTYATEDSFTKTVGLNNSDGNLVDHSVRLPRTSITGVNLDKTNFKLNFAEYWSEVAGGTPIPQFFANSIDLSQLVSPDTSWYTSTAAGQVYTLTTANQLYGFSVLASEGKIFDGQTIRLGNDIVMNEGAPLEKEKWADYIAKYNPAKWTPIKAFNGIFDGQGYSITGIYTAESSKSGLFALLYGSAKVQNLGLKNSYIYASGDMVGGIVANCKGATLTNIYTNANVMGANIIGGIVGYADSAYGTTIKEVWFDGSVIATNRRAAAFFGGLQVQSSVKDVYYSGKVIQQNAGTGAGTGSICGWLPAGGLDIQNCVIDGNISVANKYATGFLVGDNAGTVTISNVHIKNNLFPTGFNMGNGSGRTDAHWNVVNGSKAPTTTGYTFFADKSYDSELGYNALNVTFSFIDNPETDAKEDIWVARKTKAPAIKAWVSEDDRYIPSISQ